MYACNIIRMEFHVRDITCVIRIHDGTSDVWMSKAQRMSKLVHRDPQEISSRWGIMGKCFVFIKMGPSVLRVIRMRQHTSRSVKRIWTSSFHSCAVMTVSSKTETKFLILWFGERRWRIDWISSCRESLSSCTLARCL